jgi:CO dehydrogenase/acetyl-CoA synthase gamma subunit (corrinoid Fe-S protein)
LNSSVDRIMSLLAAAYNSMLLHYGYHKCLIFRYTLTFFNEEKFFFLVRRKDMEEQVPSADDRLKYHNFKF